MQKMHRAPGQGVFTTQRAPLSPALFARSRAEMGGNESES
jgi:hypothetical protein